MKWILDNKEWLFSGVGVSLILLLIWLFRRAYSCRSHPVIFKVSCLTLVLGVIALAGWGWSSGYLTVTRDFTLMYVVVLGLFGSASGWLTYLMGQKRVKSLVLELTTVKMHDTFRDHITNVLNTNAVAHTYIECMSIAKSQGGNFSALMLDLDGFKRINEDHDTPGGDRCLREVALLLAETIRGESDKLLRYRHGDEFLILLPETSGESAEFVAKRVTRLVEKTPFLVNDEQVREKLTVSVAFTGINVDTDDLDTVTARLETGLKKAKKIKNTYVKA